MIYNRPWFRTKPERALSSDYQLKLREQIDQYKDIDINVLPPIFHYWSHTYLRPILEDVFGHGAFSAIYADQFARAFAETGLRTAASLGSGDAWLEVDVAVKMKDAGERDFVIECVELSDHLIERGVRRAAEAGVSDHIRFRQVDLNSWRPEQRFGAFLASQSLHHFVNLEAIFDFVLEMMAPQGRFVSNDTIGRNGHMRWPESRAIIQYYWDGLPERFKYHHQLRRIESPQFLDWDCSVEGFEGIRAQDIMPELVKRFGFTHFAGWGGITDLFVDRGFGHNYSKDDPTHVAFIDQLEATNASMLVSGFLKPTQMCAVMVRDKNAPCRTHRGLTPNKALRDPKATITPIL